MIWSLWFYYPLIKADYELEEFYGKITLMKRLAHVDKIEFSLYDSKQTFQAYLDEKNIHDLNDYIDGSQSFRVVAQPYGFGQYLVIHLENSEFELDTEAMIEHHDMLLRYFLYGWILGLFAFAHVLYMDFKYYRIKLPNNRVG